MDPIDHKKGKIYYHMGEVAEMFDVKPSVIRFWEKKFDILKPVKNKKGNRLFTPEDVDNIKLIYHFVREKGMTLAGAQKRIKQNPEGISRDVEVLDRLQKIRAMLLEIRQELREDDGEIYHGDPLEPLGKPVGVEDLGEDDADALLDAAGEEQWVEDELVALDGLDEEIGELGSAAGVTAAEADDLLENGGELPLDEGGDADGDFGGEDFEEDGDFAEDAAESEDFEDDGGVVEADIDAADFEDADDFADDDFERDFAGGDIDSGDFAANDTDGGNLSADDIDTAGGADADISADGTDYSDGGYDAPEDEADFDAGLTEEELALLDEDGDFADAATDVALFDGEADLFGSAADENDGSADAEPEVAVDIPRIVEQTLF
ncbi:MerR family transcriptional regulator [Alistipes sp. OttesenSCG-928-B03]|nr:MerR family transcriptional regulator [Alistipes sp. OttesenSCG-928-B03]